MKTLIVFLLLSAQILLGNDYYVSAKRGDNITGDGSLEHPWKTLSFSLARIEGTGHTLNVEAGVYHAKMDTLNMANNEIFPIFLSPGITINGEDRDSVEIKGDADKFIFTAMDLHDTTTSVQNLKLTGGEQAFNFRNCSFKILNCDISGQTDCAIFAIDTHLKATSFIIVERNTIHNNQKGGIRFANVNGRINDNTLINNRDFAIALYENDTIPSDIRVYNNTISDNRIASGFGAIYCQRGAPLIYRNYLSRNTLTNESAQAAGALYCDFLTEAQFFNNILVQNQDAIRTDGCNPLIAGNLIASGTGSAIFIDSNKNDSRPFVVNNTIVDNQGDGIYIRSRTDGIVNNIIAGNTGYGIAESQSNTLFDPDSVKNNLFFENEKGVYLDEGIRVLPDVQVLDLLVPECRNNLQGDPLFADTLYHLQPISPAIDAGYQDSTILRALATDLDGNPRIVDGNSDGLAVIDIGAFELPESAAKFAPQIINIGDFSFANTATYVINLDTCVLDKDDDVQTLIWQVRSEQDSLQVQIVNRVAIFTAPGWTGQAIVHFKVTDPFGLSDSVSVLVTVKRMTGIENNSNSLPTDFSLRQNYPNPFNPATSIAFDVPMASRVTISIYNARGELVETLVDADLPAGRYERIWDASGVSSGVYFYRMRAGQFSTIKKCILLQ